MGIQTGSGEGGYVADINVTPMVDVMLVLLIIFMVITPMLQSGISVALPSTKYPDEDPNIVKESSVVLAIPGYDKNQKIEIFMGRSKIEPADIATKVKQMLKDKQPADQVVYIKSGKLVKYGDVVNTIDQIREAGFDRIGLVAEKEKGAKVAATPAK